MPEIQPFRALLYSQKLKANLKNLIAPPYDVISADFFKRLKDRHAYNAVRVSLAEDAQDPDRYKKMSLQFEAWKKEGVFERASKPGFYLIEERFNIAGVERRRIGFVGLLETSAFAERKVLPHEHTLAGPKKDRLELLKEMGAELSQVFLCYKDEELVLEKVFDRVSKSAPYFDIPEVDHVSRKLWILNDPQDLNSLQKLMSSRSALIADGHHRYETSVHFKEIDGTEKSKYVQVYMTNLNAPGFSIEPIHRLFTLPDQHSIEGFTKELSRLFKVEAQGHIDPSLLLKMRAQNKLAFFVKFRDTGSVLLCTREKKTEDDAEIFSLQNEIFEKLLGWDLSKTTQGILQYEHDLEDFEKTLMRIERGVGIFLPPTDLELVMSRAQRGERMPQKSTFFYPKIATGLVNYELGNL